ncbi:Universal stress protein family protein [Shimia sp. SK013]|uniref:universal stress protein n=1 Tax=Shimia sp. SK013 TaxID=1389006 RepID=UPI0006B5BCB3|nr:universal stress protein [Shimia sp. SK013]KPA21035.1 Universal stress protein family protein [Shimia sp. SK013]
MAYKSLLCVLTDTDFSDAPLAQGMALAGSQDAHLDVLTLGVDRSQNGYFYAGADAMMMQEMLNRARSEAQSIEKNCKKVLSASDLRWACDSGVAQIADLGRHVAQRARFADLVILPKPYGPKHGTELEPTIEAALFEGQAPVLMVPDIPAPVTTPKTICIGWNESAEALVATRAALPFLKTAEAVHVVVIDPPVHGLNRSDPGGLLSQFLSRHGVNVEVDVLSKTQPRVSDVLLRHANDKSADMIVMGAYGHSRFREAILGGATRNMLEQATMPVFMAH